MSEKMNMSLDDIIKKNKDSYQIKKKGNNLIRKFHGKYFFEKNN